MKNYFLYSILFILFSAVLYSQFIRPWYVTARTRYDYVGSLREVFAQGESLQIKRDQLQAEKNAISAEKAQLINSAVLEYSPDNVILFLLALDELMRISGLPTDVRYAVGGERTDGGTVVIPITFNFPEIRYDLLRVFIKNLQQWGKSVRIRSLQINTLSDDDLTQQDIVGSVIVIEAFFSTVSDTFI